MALPAGLDEASGAASSTYGPDVVWAHQDSGDDPVLVAVDSGGRTVATLRAPGTRQIDWEALERSDCPEGTCLWVADTGDNQERRDDPVLYRLVEPEPAVDGPSVAPAADETRPDSGSPGSLRGIPARTAEAVAHPVRFPDGPRDVEALFVLPGEDLHLVTKGRNHPVTVYRHPPPLRPGERVTLVALQTLTSGPALLPEQVTGAAASPDGRFVAIRTYRTLTFYRTGGAPGAGTGDPPAGPERGTGGGTTVLDPLPGGEVDLTTLREAQGEGVAWLSGGQMALVSEAGPAGRRGSLRFLRCEVEGR